MGDVEALDTGGIERDGGGVLERGEDGFRRRLQNAETGFETVLGVGFGEVVERLLLTALGRVDFDFAALLFAEQFFEGFAVVEVGGDVDDGGNVGLREIDLLDERGHEFGGVEVVLVFPVELAAVDDAAVAEVEEIDGEQGRFGVVGVDVDVVAGGGGHLLAVLDFVDGLDDVAEGGGFFEAQVFGGGFHALAELFRKILQAAVEEEPDVGDGGGVFKIRGEPGGAGAETAVDVVLQAGIGVELGEIDFAGGDFEVTVDEVDEAVGEVAGEVGAVVGAAVFAEAAGHEDAGELFGGDLDVRVGFVVAEEDVEAGLVLLDERVFEGERFLFVVDDDVVNVAGDTDHRAVLGAS